MFLEIFELIQVNLIDPFINDLTTSGFLNNVISFLNKVLNSFFDMFHDSPNTLNVTYIDINLVSDVMGLILFILFIYLIVSMFSIVFNTFKYFILETKKEISLTAYLDKKGGKKKIKL